MNDQTEITITLSEDQTIHLEIGRVSDQVAFHIFSEKMWELPVLLSFSIAEAYHIMATIQHTIDQLHLEKPLGITDVSQTLITGKLDENQTD